MRNFPISRSKFLHWFWKESKLFLLFFWLFSAPADPRHGDPRVRSSNFPRQWASTSRDLPNWVRPYLVESTTSRPICEVKQLQAQLVLRSVMTREPWVSYSQHFSLYYVMTLDAFQPLHAHWNRCPRSVLGILGNLVTNAKKVTVSVLYWYGKLSSLLTEIFKMILKRIKFFFGRIN